MENRKLSTSLIFKEEEIKTKEEEIDRLEALLSSLAEISLRAGTNENRVVTIFFYPKDIVPKRSYPQAVNKAVAMVQAWYYLQLGKTFDFDQAITVAGQYELKWYQENSGVFSANWGKVFEDLISQEALFWSDNRVYLIFMQGADDYYGGTQVNRGGVAMLGDIVLQDISADYTPDNFWRKYSSLGAVAHELGHAFGLGHSPIGSDSIMLDWWRLPKKGLTATEMHVLLYSEFFQ